MDRNWTISFTSEVDYFPCRPYAAHPLLGKRHCQKACCCASLPLIHQMHVNSGKMSLLLLRSQKNGQTLMDTNDTPSIFPFIVTPFHWNRSLCISCAKEIVILGLYECVDIFENNRLVMHHWWLLFLYLHFCAWNFVYILIWPLKIALE